MSQPRRAIAALLDSRSFHWSFPFFVLLYGVYWVARGSGWDGDSIVSAAQLYKLSNGALRAIDDTGTVPKILMTLLGGAVYRVTSGFELLSALAILLNAYAFSCISRWIRNLNGMEYLFIGAVAAYTPWYLQVVNADNTAFSIPLLIIGLFSYYYEQHPLRGVLILFVSGLFRPGAEAVLALMLLEALMSRSRSLRELAFILAAIVILVIHTLWGYLIAYTDHDTYWKYVIPPQLKGTGYAQNPVIFILFLKSIASQMLFHRELTILLLPAMAGLGRIALRRLPIRYLGLMAVPTFIVPASMFAYGNGQLQYSYQTEAVIAMLACVGFAWDRPAQQTLARAVALLAAVVGIQAAISAGTNNHGRYEVNPDGSGELNWRSFKDVRNAIGDSVDDLSIAADFNGDTPFLLLDFGDRIKAIDLVPKISCDDWKGYDLVVINQVGPIAERPTCLLKYVDFDLGRGKHALAHSRLVFP